MIWIVSTGPRSLTSIEAVVAVNDHRPDCAQRRQSLGDRVQKAGLVHAHELPAGPGRVGQRSQQVEDRRKPQRHAHGHSVLGRGMMVNREAKADPRFFETLGLRGSVGVYVHPELSQNLS